jgi:hypothetical protein
MNATQLTTDLANRLNDVKVLKWHFDPDLTKTSGKLTFWGKKSNIEIELVDIGNTTPNKIMLVPRVEIGRLNALVADRVVQDILTQVSDEEEAYDLVMATVRGIASAML